MNTVQANLINGISLILLGFWGYLDVDSPTALIPVFFGIILLLCHRGIKKENKTIAHIGNNSNNKKYSYICTYYLLPF